MIHEAYMPVYMGSRFSLRVYGFTRGSTRGPRGPKNGNALLFCDVNPEECYAKLLSAPIIPRQCLLPQLGVGQYHHQPKRSI